MEHDIEALAYQFHMTPDEVRDFVSSGVPWVTASLVRNPRSGSATKLVPHQTGLGPGCIDRFRARRLRRRDHTMVDLWARIPVEDALPGPETFRAVDAALAARGEPPRTDDRLSLGYGFNWDALTPEDAERLAEQDDTDDIEDYDL
jgi:hypothetical protein